MNRFMVIAVSVAVGACSGPWLSLAGEKDSGVAVVRPGTLVEMVRLGRYDHQSHHINEKNFPVNPDRFSTDGLVLISFDRVMTTAEVLGELRVRSLRAATIEELLAHGAARPEEQGEFSVIALGSQWVNQNGARRVPGIFGSGNVHDRLLGLSWHITDYRWRPTCKFLASLK